MLLGMVLIMIAAAISVGAITVWATRLQATERQMRDGRMLGSVLAKVLTPALSEDTGRLHRIVNSVTVGSTIREVDVVGPRNKVLASSKHAVGKRLNDRDLMQAARTAQQVVRAEEESGLLAVCTPIFDARGVAGVVRIRVPWGPEGLSWPLLFWILMGIDGLLIVMFLWFVLTRYVIEPVRTMQTAAAQVTGGDLAVRLPERGAEELASLAGSFNAMTGSLLDKLHRLDVQRQELASSREQVIRSEKLASVGRLAAGVAHEVGNPLQAIMGYTDMLLHKELKLEERKDLLSRVDNETQRIHRIIRELLDYARPVEESIEPVPLEAVVEQAQQLVGPQRKLRGVTIESEGLSTLPAAAANTQRLVQVLVNLLLNAADAMSGEGKISIRGGHDEEGERVSVSVANDGPAIPPQDRARIFDPFFTTKEPGDGTGLGLSVAQAIVESYGGELVLAAEPETTFVITLATYTG